MIVDRRARELVPLLRKAAALDDSLFSTFSAFCTAAIATGDRALFDTGVKRLDELGKKQYVFLHRSTRAWFDADPAQVLKECEQLKQLDLPRFRCEGSIQEGNVYAEAGLYDRAAACYETASAERREAVSAGIRARAFASLGFCRLAVGESSRARAAAEGILDSQDSVIGFSQAASLMAMSGFPADSRNLIRRLHDCPDVPQTRIAISLAESELARAQNDAPGYERSMAAALRQLPRLGYHDCFDRSLGNHQWAELDAVKWGPLFFWYYNDFVRPGAWGRCARTTPGVAGVQSAKLAAALAALR